MSAIASEPKEARAIGATLRSWFTFQAVPRRAIALAGFVVGSLVTITTVAVMSRSPGGVFPTAGTMMRPEAGTGTRVGFDRLEVGDSRFDLETFASGRNVRLVIRGRFDDGTDLTVSFEPSQLQFKSFEPLEGESQAKMSAGRALIAGRGRSVIALGWVSRVPDPGPVRVAARAGRAWKDVRLPAVAADRDVR